LWDVAIVVFQVVNAPRSPGGCVESLVAIGCGVASTGCCTAIAIDANFESQGMDTVCYTFDSRWEFGWVGNELVGGAVSTRLDRPAVVDWMKVRNVPMKSRMKIYYSHIHSRHL